MDFVKEIKEGKIFIYPTDTIYGIGCNAGNVESIQKIRKLKRRDGDKSMSVVAPSKEWILEHCVVDIELLDEYFPGPYTLILEKREPDFLKEISSDSTLGVRILDCEFMEEIAKAGVAFVSTSVNFSGKVSSVRIEDVEFEILNNVDVVIDAGVLDNKPSVLVRNGKEILR